MNSVEIEEAVADLATKLFDNNEFPYDFLAAFGAKDTTLKRLRKGDSDVRLSTGASSAQHPLGQRGLRQVSEAFAALPARPKRRSA